MATQRNPFNPDGTWNWSNVGDLDAARSAGETAADAWRKASKKAEEPWNQWQSQKSIQELNAYNQWKQAYVKFNDMTTKPGENWFRQEWDKSESYYWFEAKNNPWYDGKDYEECLAFRHFFESGNTLNAREQEANWDSYGRAEWWANKSRPDAWKELLKQAERNRQQQKQERTWESYGGRNQGKSHWYQQYKDFFNSGKRELTEELARALILSNLDKFDVHYAEYWQRQRRMQMNEAKSKIGQLSIVHVPSVAKQFLTKLEQSGGDADRAGVNDILRRVFGDGSKEIPAEMDNYVKLLMSPLFKWNQ